MEMLRSFLRSRSTSHDPFQQRWAYFQGNLSTIPAAIALVESVPEDKLRDVTFLERELIPSLGLNNENLWEQPAELSNFFGAGLHIFQYPNQFARYLVWLAEHGKDSQIYVEIGSRWGGTFIVTCEWLRRIGAPLQSAIAIDPIGETPMINLYGQHLSRQHIDYQFIQDLSTSHAVKSLFQNRHPDFVLIDGDHSMKGALADHMLARESAKIIVHHDIASDACPDTTALWDALKTLEAATFAASEFTDQYPSVDGSFLGIGALKRKAV
jgi:cephalosporin hydroxylase